MSAAVAEKPKTRLQELWERSKDERNHHLKDGWKFIGFGEVSNGHQVVWLTGTVANKCDNGNAMRHIQGALKKRSTPDGEE